MLHRSATNDFDDWMDDVYRTNAMIEGQRTRYSWVTHMNHPFAEPDTAVTERPAWTCPEQTLVRLEWK